MDKTIKIGTRDSELALWQATTVQKKLEDLGYQTELIPVKSLGDIVLDKPLYELGITGIFTKTLDVAMLTGEIDIAVHSMKDVPTALPKGIVKGAVLERAASLDILVYRQGHTEDHKKIIATGSLRRKAQWLHKYPDYSVVDLRGNVNTRLKKLSESDWEGAVFAKAGLARIDLLPDSYRELDWMVPAPAQGAVLVVVRDNDSFCKDAVAKINHQPTELCTTIEREFLRELEGGCTAPIGALAVLNGRQIDFTGVLFSLDGKQKLEVTESVSVEKAEGFGKACAQEILTNGGDILMKAIKEQIQK
ncbi:MAG: hydroxymethylbilane synthase [Flavobacteriaceae bacterium]|nr:hydroxymethylbilane synthase [Flavobacteriaceae bacterium]